MTPLSFMARLAAPASVAPSQLRPPFDTWASSRRPASVQGCVRCWRRWKRTSPALTQLVDSVSGGTPELTSVENQHKFLGLGPLVSVSAYRIPLRKTMGFNFRDLDPVGETTGLGFAPRIPPSRDHGSQLLGSGSLSARPLVSSFAVPIPVRETSDLKTRDQDRSP